ncbi:MAG: SEC-C metal-binding domain-containing protein [Myxococcota bacterium]
MGARKRKAAAPAAADTPVESPSSPVPDSSPSPTPVADPRPLIAAAAAAGTCRRDVRALAESLTDPAAATAALTSAVAGRRDLAFTHLALAMLHRGHPVDAAVLIDGAALVPTAELLAAIAGRLTGAVGDALVAAVRRHGLGEDREPQALLVAELWSRRAERPRPDGMIAEARIRARRVTPIEGADARVALHGLIDDPDLAALIEPLAQADVKESARASTVRLVDALVGGPLQPLPERPVREAKSAGPVRRAVGKVGRNDACPCGSGKKYKHCHESADRERLADSSDVEGLTLAELQKDLERHLTEERILDLRGHELARLDPSRVRPELRDRLAEALAQWGELDRAVEMAEVWTADATSDELVDGVAGLVAEYAARDGRPDLTRRLLARVTTGAERLLLEARLALTDDPAARLATIEAAARTELDQRGVDLGFALMVSGLPALGIHVARSELVLRARDPHTDGLYANLVETRDLLLAPPWDPIDDVLYTIDHGVTPDVDRELLKARQKAEGGEAALKATRDALESVKAELERREAEVVRAPAATVATVAAVPAAGPVDDGAMRELRDRVEKLKSELKDRHRERNALRRELEDTRAQVAELEREHEDEGDEAAAEVEDGDDEPGIDMAVAARLRVPVFPHDFHDRLREVPEATARMALARLGELCAGYDTAFREVRPLRGFDGTWRVKIGRSYRLLFRPLDRTLEVVELLHRQDLEKRLFRLRRGGEG